MFYTKYSSFLRLSLYPMWIGEPLKVLALDIHRVVDHRLKNLAAIGRQRPGKDEEQLILMYTISKETAGSSRCREYIRRASNGS